MDAAAHIAEAARRVHDPVAALEHLIAAWRLVPAGELAGLIDAHDGELPRSAPIYSRADWDRVAEAQRAHELGHLIGAISGLDGTDQDGWREHVRAVFRTWPDDPRIRRWCDLPARAPEVLDDRARAALVHFLERRGEHRDAERALLDQVAREPDSDAPRLIYGDWLQQLGDPRAELIALQCAGRELDDTEQARVQELVRIHGHRWCGDLGSAVRAVAFERGFASEVEIELFHSGLLDRVDFATVRTLWLGAATGHFLLTDHAAKIGVGLGSLRVVHGLESRELVAAAEHPPLKITTVTACRVVDAPGRRPGAPPSRDPRPIDRLRPGLPALTRMTLVGPAPQWELGAEVLGQLVELRATATDAGDWLARVLALGPRLEHVEVVDRHGRYPLELRLQAGSARLSRLELRIHRQAPSDQVIRALRWIVAAMPAGLIRELVAVATPAAEVAIALAPLKVAIEYVAPGGA